MNTTRKLIAASLALIITLANTALALSPVAFAGQAPVVSSAPARSAAAAQRALRPQNELQAAAHQGEPSGLGR